MATSPSIKTPTNPIGSLPTMAKVGPFSEATGIHERAVRRALNSGELPGRRIGRVWYVNTAAALALLGISE